MEISARNSNADNSTLTTQECMQVLINLAQRNIPYEHRLTADEREAIRVAVEMLYATTVPSILKDYVQVQVLPLPDRETVLPVTLMALENQERALAESEKRRKIKQTPFDEE